SPPREALGPQPAREVSAGTAPAAASRDRVRRREIIVDPSGRWTGVLRAGGGMLRRSGSRRGWAAVPRRCARHGLFPRPARGAPLLSRSSVSRALTLSPVRAAAQEARRAAILQVLARRDGMRAESARPTAPRAAS